MSTRTIRSSIASVQREIQSEQRKLTEKSRQELNKTAKIASTKKSINKNTSASTVQSKLRAIDRVEADIFRIQKRKVDIEKRIADKKTKLYKLQQDLDKAQQREQESALKKLKQQQSRAEASRRQELLDLSQVKSQSFNHNSATEVDMHDAFISYAREDQEEIANPLADMLSGQGFDIWYDDFKLTIGDGLRRSIDKGLAKARFGIVVLSPDFFAKNWTQYELDGLVQKEMAGNKVILPIWHKLSKEEVMGYSPSLADKLALNTAAYTLEEIADQIADVIKG